MNFSNIYKTDGSSDSKRLSTALIDCSFKIHALSFLQLISCSSRYGKYINYFNLENRIDGTWADSFTGDELTVISDIHCFNLDKYLGKLFFELNNENISGKTTENLINDIFKIIFKIDHWIKLLSNIRSNDSSYFVRAVIQFIEGVFSEHYELLLSITKSLSDKNRILRIPEITGYWRKYETNEISSFNGKDIKSEIKSILYSLQNLVFFLNKNLEIFLDESLKRSDHSPETGLLFTFLQLFKNVQNEINRIPEKYVLFYYQKILQYASKKSLEDSAFVTIQCNSSVKTELIIPKGTEFIAEVNDTSLTYKADTDVIIQNAQIQNVFFSLPGKG